MTPPPRIELHVHFEGTVGPEGLAALAERNRVALPPAGEVAALYAQRDLKHVAQLWRLITSALRTADDFREIVVAYAREAKRHRIGPRKRLRGEIEGDLGVVRAAGQEEQDRVRVPPVRGREYGSIAKIGRIIRALGAHTWKCHEARYP